MHKRMYVPCVKLTRNRSVGNLDGPARRGLAGEGDTVEYERILVLGAAGMLGQDLVGLNPDYATARKVYDAYKPHFAARVQEKFNGHLLGLWPFGPQVLFCKPEISGLKDIKGKKVRVYDQSLAQFVESLGATPVPIGFSEVQQVAESNAREP